MWIKKMIMALMSMLFVGFIAVGNGDDRESYILEMKGKNKVGSTAVDFKFLLKNGEYSTLHALNSKYVLLYFNNPDCDDCKLLKNKIIESKIISQLLDSGNLTVLSVCAFGKTEDWVNQRLPESWLDSCDENMTILDNDLYYLPVFPALYLLDNAHKVLLKNARLKSVEEKLQDALKRK